MKIKHWAGYGCVNARKINDGSCKLHVRVEGNHECGLERGAWDTFTLYNWLVKRFDKSVPDELSWSRSHPLIDIRSDFRMDPKLGYVEVCDYYFTY